MIVRSRRVAALGAALAAAALLTACSSAGADNQAPDWSPQPSFAGDGGTVVPQQNSPLPGGTPSTGAPNPSAPSSSAPASGDPNVVATKLNSPVGIALLPDGTALVGERTTGRILRVQPTAGQPVQVVRTITGISTAGGGGLLDLALSPTYDEDNLIFAYITTATDNRVVDFTLTGAVTPVLTGIPRGSVDNAGRIMFGADGDLYVGTGDAGTAPNATSFAGKILRITPIGQPAAGNPTAGSPIFASGTQEVDGLCSDVSGGAVYETEARPAAATDVVRELEPGAWTALPAPTARGLGGCAVAKGVLFVASRDGKALLGTPITTSGSTVKLGAYTAYLTGKYGRLISVVAAPDDSLWLTTSNKDGHGTPTPDDDRVLHIQSPINAGSSPV